MKKDEKILKRIITSYKLMLDFYGMKLKEEEGKEIERSKGYKTQYSYLNEKWNHNFLRITRMLKSLGEFGFEEYKYNFLKFVIKEIYKKKTLNHASDACENYWIETIKDDKLRFKLKKKIKKYLDE
jgi:hypothetical protein